jgi:putative ABC transport system substrate-binding protein
MLREVVPGLKRVAVLANMSNPVIPLQWNEIEAAARPLDLQLQLLDVRKPEDLGGMFDAAIGQRADALLVTINSFTQANRRSIIDLAARHRLPAMYLSREFVEVGGLIAYGVSYPDLYRRAATYVDKILKGAKPADLPTKFELVVNLKAAAALDLSIPPSPLVRADEVIE